MPALPLIEAARELDVRVGTLRAWVRQGCPVAQRGRRGRGHAVLVDPVQVRQWRQADERAALVLELAGTIPEAMAAATEDALRMAQGMDKRALAGVLAATWYTTTSAVLDHLRERCAAVPEVKRLPDAIERLKKIAGG